MPSSIATVNALYILFKLGGIASISKVNQDWAASKSFPLTKTPSHDKHEDAEVYAAVSNNKYWNKINAIGRGVPEKFRKKNYDC